MAFTLGKDTIVKLGANDLSAFTNSMEFTRTADTHDVTAYGNLSHAYIGGLLDAKVTISGTYDNGATGPRKIIEPLIGTTVSLTRQPEGTGSGKPQDVVSIVVNSYQETSPVADTVKWSMEGQCTGEVASTSQA